MKQSISLRTGLRLAAAVLLAGAWGGGKAAAGEIPAETREGKTEPSLPQRLRLDEAIRLALAHNPALRAVSGKRDAAAGRAAQARLWSNPELELTAEEWPVSGGGGFSDAKQTIGVTQTLPFPGKKRLDGRIGGAGVTLSELEFRWRQTEVVRDVQAAFFGVLAAERSFEVASELEKVASSSATTARRRVEAGATSYQEQLRAEIQWEQVKTELNGFREELGAARQRFATLLGRPGLQEVPLSGALVESGLPQLLERAAQATVAAHPSMAAARADRDRAALERRRARLEPYPDVKVGVAGGRLGESDESIIELRLSLPLPIIDRSKGRQQEAAANLAMAEAEMESVEHQLDRQLSNATLRYRTAAEQVATYRDRILPKATEALSLVQSGFAEGKFNFMDLLDTQRTTAEARLAYQKRLLELNVAQAELEALLNPQ